MYFKYAFQYVFLTFFKFKAKGTKVLHLQRLENFDSDYNRKLYSAQG